MLQTDSHCCALRSPSLTLPHAHSNHPSQLASTLETGSPGPDSARPWASGSCQPSRNSSKIACDGALHRTTTGSRPHELATPMACSKQPKLELFGSSTVSAVANVEEMMCGAVSRTAEVVVMAAVAYGDALPVLLDVVRAGVVVTAVDGVKDVVRNAVALAVISAIEEVVRAVVTPFPPIEEERAGVVVTAIAAVEDVERAREVVTAMAAMEDVKRAWVVVLATAAAIEDVKRPSVVVTVIAEVRAWLVSSSHRRCGVSWGRGSSG
eukprot:1641788-Rhodomonas_salina.1